MNYHSSPNIAVFGGTFDPPQEGHVDAIQQALESVQTVVVAPTIQNPWKTTRKPSSLEHRVEMLRRVVLHAGLHLVEEFTRPGIVIFPFHYTYSVELVRELRRQLGADSSIKWIVGSDSADTAKDWKDWATEGVPLLIVQERILVHATDVREGRVPPHPAIRGYVAEHGLYR